MRTNDKAVRINKISINKWKFILNLVNYLNSHYQYAYHFFWTYLFH